MERITEFFTNQDFLMGLISIMIASFSTVLVGQILYKKEKARKTPLKDKAFEVLDAKFESGLVSSKNDIEIILNSIYRKSYESYSISSFLEDYITYRINVSKETPDQTKIHERYKLLKTIIEGENKEKPFEDLPDEERRLLVGIGDGLKNQDLESIKFNLNELHSVISTRNKLFEKTSRLNKWSIPLAIIGTFFTVFFGVLSILPNNDYKEAEKTNQVVIEKLDKLIHSDSLIMK